MNFHVKSQAPMFKMIELWPFKILTSEAEVEVKFEADIKIEAKNS